MPDSRAEVLDRLTEYVMRYFDALPMEDAKQLLSGFRNYLRQNPASKMQSIPPPEVVEENVSDKPTAQISLYDVYSWRPAPANTDVKCTEVHLVLPIGKGRVALRLKSARALDELVGALLQHRKDVWP